MKKCPECKKNLAENATTCPKCGYKFSNAIIGFLFIILALILFFLLPFVSGLLWALFFFGSVFLVIWGIIKIIEGVIEQRSYKK